MRHFAILLTLLILSACARVDPKTSQSASSSPVDAPGTPEQFIDLVNTGRIAAVSGAASGTSGTIDNGTAVLTPNSARSSTRAVGYTD